MSDSEEIARLVKWLEDMYSATNEREASRTDEAKEKLLRAATIAHERWREDPSQPAMIHVIFDDGEEIAEAIPPAKLTEIFTGKDTTDDVADRMVERTNKWAWAIASLAVAGPLLAMLVAWREGVFDKPERDDHKPVHQSEAPLIAPPAPPADVVVSSCTCVAEGDDPPTTFVLHAPTSASGRWFFEWKRPEAHYMETSTFWIAPITSASLGIACHGDTVVLVAGDVATAWARGHYGEDIPLVWTRTLPKRDASTSPPGDASDVTCTPLAKDTIRW